MNTEPMTVEQYLKEKGFKCPACGGTEIEFEEHSPSGGLDWKSKCTCQDPACKATWTDSLRLLGYSDLVIPTKEISNG
jgi:hypothetical protein